MLAVFLFLVLVAIVLGLVGVVVKGLLFLLFIGIVVFLGALLLVPCKWAPTWEALDAVIPHQASGQSSDNDPAFVALKPQAPK